MGNSLSLNLSLSLSLSVSLSHLILFLCTFPVIMSVHVVPPFTSLCCPLQPGVEPPPLEVIVSCESRFKQTHASCPRPTSLCLRSSNVEIFLCLSHLISGFIMSFLFCCLLFVFTQSGQPNTPWEFDVPPAAAAAIQSTRLRSAYSARPPLTAVYRGILICLYLLVRHPFSLLGHLRSQAFIVCLRLCSF